MGTMGNLEHHFYQIFHVLLRVEKVSAPITHPTTLTATLAGYFQSLLLDEVRESFCTDFIFLPLNLLNKVCVFSLPRTVTPQHTKGEV